MSDTSPTAEAVCALVQRSDGCYLIIRRAQDLPGGGFWCPVTGRPEEGENLRETAAREVLEEVGLRITVRNEIFSCPTSDGRYTLRWFDCIPALPHTGFESLTLRTEEVSEARWLTAHQATLLTPTFESTVKFFKGLESTE